MVATACGGGSSGSPTPVQPPTGLRVVGTQTGGASGDALAASLLLATGSSVSPPAQRPVSAGDPGLRAELAFRATSHVEAAALSAGAGPSLEGSARIRRLAAAPGAPADANGNGTNLDETLAVDLRLIAHTAGAESLPEFAPSLFSWRESSSVLAADPGGAGRENFAAFRVQTPGARIVETEQIGHAMLARTREASRLLMTGRGSFAGGTPDEGARGLLLMQQVVAMEETLLTSLFHDGAAFGRVPRPAEYDPRFDTPRWLPRAFTTIDDPNLSGAPVAYAPDDRASSLSGLSSVLAAASELTWLASDENPHRALRDVLRGQPFGAKPAPATLFPVASAASAAASTSQEITWEDDIKPLVQGQCLSCHGLFAGFEQAGYSVATYEATIAGGNSKATHPGVVVGEHQNSLLWQILVGPVPAINKVQMPPGGPYWDPEDIQLVADWIDGGAKRGGAEGEIRVGLDLGRVLVRNLEWHHMDAATGALHERHEGDDPSGYAASRSTGEALSALAAYVSVVPDDTSAVETLTRAAEHAVDTLALADGTSVDAVEIATGVQVGGRADLVGHARLTAGLLAAGRALGRTDLQDRGRALAGTLLTDYLDAATGLFNTDLRRTGRRYTPVTLAAVVEALREISADGVMTGAEAALDRFMARIRATMVFSEWDGRGEVLGDGIPDTDGNGVAEPAAAGGSTGLAPLFVGELLHGLAPSLEPLQEPATWSSHIQPLFRQKCAGCHLDGVRQGGYSTDTPTLLRVPGVSQGSGLQLVVPGDPEQSFLYLKLAERNPPLGAQMPEAGPPLSAAGLQLVYRWIAEGATTR